LRFRPCHFLLFLICTSTHLAAEPLKYTGVNLSGAEFGSPKPNVRPVAFKDFIDPTKKDIAYFKSIGMNVMRVPFRWETIQPALDGPLDAKELDRLADSIKAITDAKCVALLDVHNYARYCGKVVGGAEVPSAALAGFWTKLAERFKDDPLVWFGLMNEPHDMPAEQWLGAANDSIAAIRKTGSTNLILVPGIAWSGAHSWESSGNARTMLGIVDPADKYVIEVHQYLDADSSGTKPLVVSPTIGSERLKVFTDWCRLHHRKAFLGEFGAPATAQGKAAIEDLLQSMQKSADVWTGFTWWSAGPWWGKYMFSIEPNKDGSDAGQIDYLRPFLQPVPEKKAK
jgi:endoglucanase